PFLGIGNGFLRAFRRVGHSVLFLRMGSLAGLRHDAIGLIAELRGELAVSFHDLGGRMDWLFVAGVLGAAICAASAPLKPLFAMACSICWRRGLEASRYSCE